MFMSISIFKMQVRMPTNSTETSLLLHLIHIRGCFKLLLLRWKQDKLLKLPYQIKFPSSLSSLAKFGIIL